MKILLTGGAGFIGSHLADLFIASGHEVVVIDDLSKGKKENVNPEAKFYCRNITEVGIEGIFDDERPDVLVHHAAQVSVSASVKDPVADMEINIKGTIRLLEACVRFGVKKVVFSSTGGAIYGEQVDFPADESHPLNPLSPYGIGKLACEKYLYFYRQTHGLNYTILRYSNVYGPRQDPFGEAGVIAIFSRRMLSGKTPVINGTGEQTRDFVFVKDVARANLLALEGDFSGTVNIGTGKETTINQLFFMLQKIIPGDVSAEYAPALPGEQFRSVLSCEKAFRELGWQPDTQLETGLKETVMFFKGPA